MKSIFLVVSLICSVALSSAEINTPAIYGSCPEDEYQDLTCTIDSVTVEGCRKDRNSNACRVKRNVKAAINIDFTPRFDGSNVTMMAYALMPGIEKSFPDMNDDACVFTTCPMVHDRQQTYTYGLKLGPAYPLGLFNVRFLMKQDEQVKCCFVTKFRIEK